jgi:hypothetical protein
MNALETALYSLFTGDGTLAALVPGGVHNRRVAQGTSGRALVFSKLSGVPDYTFGEQVQDLQFTYIVKVIDIATSSATARTAKERARTLLLANPLSVSGHVSLLVRKEGEVEYDETLAGGQVVQHVGDLYRIIVRPS